MKIAYQGLAGAYSHIAAKRYFGNKNDFIPVPDFSDLFLKLVDGDVDFAMLPVENSLAGSVIQNLDLLFKQDAWITGEIYLEIDHCLLGLPQTNFENITEVYSQEKALQQCQNFFLSNPQIHKIAYSNTAASAQMVANSKRLDLAAIASLEAAQIYNLQVLQENIQDDAHNWTRFVAVTARNKINPVFDNVSKCSLAYTLPKDVPGSLHKSLQPFSENNINLSNIESRPIPGKFFEYIFYVDFEFDPKNAGAVQIALSELAKLTKTLKILGVYQKQAKFVK
ncbi:MAG: prephenate dehydratase [bacterium]